MLRRYNLRADLADFRDLIFKRRTAQAPLPSFVDLRSKCSPVMNQGNEGSCTAHAGVAFVEFLQLQGDHDFCFEGGFAPLSRNFLYYNERTLDGDVTQDAGSSLRTCVKALAAYGICPEADWPYDLDTLFKAPPQSIVQEASQHLITEYTRLSTLDDMRAVLASGFPFLLGFTVYDSFEDIGSDGLMPMPKLSESSLGGHAVLCVGYNDQTNRAIVRNSWGPDWGDNGHFYMPYDYLTNPGLSSDFWTIRQ